MFRDWVVPLGSLPLSSLVSGHGTPTLTYPRPSEVPSPCTHLQSGTPFPGSSDFCCFTQFRVSVSSWRLVFCHFVNKTHFPTLDYSIFWVFWNGLLSVFRGKELSLSCPLDSDGCFDCSRFMGGFPSRGVRETPPSHRLLVGRRGGVGVVLWDQGTSV